MHISKCGTCDYRRRRWNSVFQPVARSHRRAVAWLQGPPHLAPVTGRVAQRVRGLRVDVPREHGNKTKQNSTFRVRQTISTQTEKQKAKEKRNKLLKKLTENKVKEGGERRQEPHWQAGTDTSFLTRNSLSKGALASLITQIADD